MERLPAVSLYRFGFEVVPDADGVRQRPADRDAEPDARDPQRRSREQIGQRHAGAQRSNGQDDRHHGLVDLPVVSVEQEQNAGADIARAFDAPMRWSPALLSSVSSHLAMQAMPSASAAPGIRAVIFFDIRWVSFLLHVTRK